jgi:hypothetical protein
MAKIWFLKAGEVHEGNFVADKPLDFCIDVLGLRVRNWHSPLERNEPLIIGSKEDPNVSVVVEVTSKDLSYEHPHLETGYYLLDIETTEIRELLTIFTK